MPYFFFWTNNLVWTLLICLVCSILTSFFFFLSRQRKVLRPHENSALSLPRMKSLSLRLSTTVANNSKLRRLEISLSLSLSLSLSSSLCLRLSLSSTVQVRIASIDFWPQEMFTFLEMHANGWNEREARTWTCQFQCCPKGGGWLRF